MFTNQNPLPEQKRQGNAGRVFPCSFVGVLMKKIKIFICIGMIAMLLLVMESGFNEEPIQYIDEYSFFYPYENIEFADKKTVQVLMEAYEKVDFFGEFQKGNLEVYDFYKEKYSSLLNNEITFTLPETGEQYYLKDYEYVVSGKNEFYDVRNYSYLFFDMNGDGAPELVMTDRFYFIYYFRYDKNTETMNLWYQTGFFWESVHGTGTVRWDREGRQHLFCRLDENGKEVCRVMFFERDSNGEMVYMAALPSFADEETVLSRRMRKYACYSEGFQVYYFRVTEDQYDALTERYYEAVEESNICRDEVTFTYDELFQ